MELLYLTSLLKYDFIISMELILGRRKNGLKF